MPDVPGVPVEETSGGPSRIEGVPTSAMAMIGPTTRGPLTPVHVDDVSSFTHVFGGPCVGSWVPQAVQACFANGGHRLLVCRVVGEGAAAAQARIGDLVVQASSPGTWGNAVALRVEHGPAGRVDMRVGYWPGGVPAGDPFEAGQPAPEITEVLVDLSTDARGDVRHPAPTLVSVALAVTAPADQPGAGVTRLQAGRDGATPALEDYLGAPGAGRDVPQGLAALDVPAFDHVAVVHAPAATPAVAAAVVAHCARRRDRFAVVDGTVDIIAAPRLAIGDSAWGACYWPWLLVPDPATGRAVATPPGGAVLGVYARVDVQRGVFKAPGNEAIVGPIGVAEALTHLESEDLTWRGVNPVRALAGQGVRVWGARTLSSDPEWRYVSVRRYAIYLEQSIARGTRWAVFEASTPASWARVVAAIDDFLIREWRRGGLQGATPKEAFFARCDASTMTADDIASGRLVCLIGVALVRPAEFIIFRVGHHVAPS